MCYNLDIGSVIAAPAHDEVVTLPTASSGGSAGASKGAADATAGATS